MQPLILAVTEFTSSTSPVEAIAAALGLSGALLLALRIRISGWGFVCYLISNAAWIVFALQHGHGGLLLQQLAFTLTSLLGIWVWLFGSPAPRAEPELLAKLRLIEDENKQLRALVASRQLIDRRT